MMQPIPDTHSIGQGRDAVMEVFGVRRNLRRAALGLAAICLALLVPSALALAEPSAPRFTGAEQRREQTSPGARPLNLSQGDLDLWRSQDPPPVPPGAVRPSDSSGATTDHWPGGVALPIASAAGLAALLATIAGLREDRKVIPDPIPFASDTLGPVTVPWAPVSLDMPDGAPLSGTVTPDIASNFHVSPYDKIPATGAPDGGDGSASSNPAADGNGTDSTGTGGNGVTAVDSAPSATSSSVDSTGAGSDTESQSPILAALEGFGNRLWKFTDKVFGFSQVGTAYEKWRDGTGSGADFAKALTVTGLKVLGAAALVAATVVCAPIVAGGGLIALGAAATTSAVVGASVGVLTAATIGGAWSLMDAAAANKSGEDIAADTLGGAIFGAGLGGIASGVAALGQGDAAGEGAIAEEGALQGEARAAASTAPASDVAGEGEVPLQEQGASTTTATDSEPVSGAQQAVPAPNEPPGVTYEGSLYRTTRPNHDPLLIHEGNIAANHRYSGPGQGALYFSSSEKLNAAELSHYGVSMDGMITHTWEVKLDNMLDLTNPATREQLGVDLQSLVGEDYSVTQAIGKRAQELGYSGIIAPSARGDGGVNIVLFDPAALTRKERG